VSATQKQRYEIKDGPGKFDLAFGLFQGNNTPRWLQFKVIKTYNGGDAGIGPVPGENEIEIAVRITGVSREDGSGESYNITGFSSSYISGYFRTDRRTGFLHMEQ
jgi:hypothetical protein